VPHLRSITDTSYFPTDELDQVPDSTPSDPGAAGKDMAFLGLVFPHYDMQPILNTFQPIDIHSNASRFQHHKLTVFGDSRSICT